LGSGRAKSARKKITLAAGRALHVADIPIMMNTFYRRAAAPPWLPIK